MEGLRRLGLIEGEPARVTPPLFAAWMATMQGVPAERGLWSRLLTMVRPG